VIELAGKKKKERILWLTPEKQAENDQIRLLKEMRETIH